MIMEAFKDRRSAAEALYIHEIEADQAQRFRRIRRLGQWACGIIKKSRDDESRYLELLCSLAMSQRGESAVVERVCDDVATAGVSVSIDSLARILAMAELKRPHPQVFAQRR